MVLAKEEWMILVICFAVCCDLDDEDLQLLVASLEHACARGFLARLQVLPNRLEFSSLCDDVCLRRLRFTRRQIHSLYNAFEIHDFYTAPCRTTWRGIIVEGLLLLLRQLSNTIRTLGPYA